MLVAEAGKQKLSLSCGPKDHSMAMAMGNEKKIHKIGFTSSMKPKTKMVMGTSNMRGMV